MRKFINIVENAHQEWPAEIVDDLTSWQGYADYNEVHGDERHDWQRRLIEFMRAHPPQLDGWLYRSTVVWDNVAEQLRRGEPALHKKVGSLLESWSKKPSGAASYAKYHEDQSVVFMGVPAQSLKVVCDLDQVPFPIDHDVESNEVLVMAEDRLIRPDQVIALCWCDYANEENGDYHHYSIEPVLGVDVSKKEWMDVLNKQK